MRFAAPEYTANLDKQILQGVMGMSGESGEAIDIVKKVLFQGLPYNDDTKLHLAKEIGDVLWYVAATADAIGYDLENIMKMNIDKLSNRYKSGKFSVEESVHRKEGDI